MRDLGEDGSALLREEYMSDITLCQAAQALQIPLLETASMMESMKNVMLVQLHGWAIPAVHAAIITRKTAVMHIEDGAVKCYVVPSPYMVFDHFSNRPP